MRTFDAIAVKKEILSPKQYIKKVQRDSSNIKSTRIQVARLGSKAFGGLEVEYQSPEYRVHGGK